MREGYRVLVEGEARGELVVLSAPLSFWGGFDPETGEIVDRNHPDRGRMLTGRIVAMPHGRGSSSSSSVLAESLRLGTGPAGLVVGEPDGILVAGATVARLLYAVACPVLWGALPSHRPGIWTISKEGLEPVEQG